MDGNIPEHPLQANFSHLSCLYPPAFAPRHHPLTSPLGKNAARNRAAKCDKKRQRICRNLSLQLVAFCCLLSLDARFDFNEQFSNLARARVTPRQDEIFTARQSLAGDCADSRKLDDATAGKTSCKMLRVMLTACQHWCFAICFAC